MENSTNETLTEPSKTTPPVASDPVSVSLNMSNIVSLCAAGLFICFFLPWINFLLAKPSGLDFAKEGGKFILLWAIPIFSAVTVFAGVTKNSNQKAVAQLTGALPFFVLGAALYNDGKDVMRVLEIGAYAGLAIGLVLFLVARRLK